MTIGVVVIMYLVTMCCVAMLFIWQYYRAGRKEPTRSKEVRFALEEGQTILGVMDRRGRMYFCIGKNVMDERNYE